MSTDQTCCERLLHLHSADNNAVTVLKRRRSESEIIELDHSVIVSIVYCAIAGQALN